jgi:hypothetical protein|tara:strand:- start:12940 stop:13329 length:390 start_codon:yes stop_codon:yes gene_type:complete
MMTRREMNWKIVRSIIPIIALGAIYYYTQSIKMNYETEKPVLVTDAKDLIWRFQMDAAKELLFQVVHVTGTITGMDSLLVILNHKLICAPDGDMKLNPIIGETVTYKGRCIGYDVLLDEVRMDHVYQLK